MGGSREINGRCRSSRAAQHGDTLGSARDAAVGMKILLADDHALMRAGLRLALVSSGFEVVGEAERGSEVLPLVRRRSPDVVLLDLRLPEMDGLTCLQRLGEQFPDVKVVMCSVSSDPDQIQGAFKRGACGYILKTINPVDLGSAIRQAVEGTAYHALGLPAMNEETFARSAGLTDRESEIIKAVTRGLSNKAIAEDLWVTIQTVKFHLTSIYRKLGVSNRTEAAGWALAKGLLYEAEVGITVRNELGYRQSNVQTARLPDSQRGATPSARTAE
jgi:DNA-binding NarL/FixJ family response regulator